VVLCDAVTYRGQWMVLCEAVPYSGQWVVLCECTIIWTVCGSV